MSSPKSSGTNTPKDLSGNKPRKFQNGWTEEQEKLLAKWSDYAACYRWLHDRSEKKYSNSNNLILLLYIFVSDLTPSDNAYNNSNKTDLVFMKGLENISNSYAVLI
jgi:hypothetical protein